MAFAVTAFTPALPRPASVASPQCIGRKAVPGRPASLMRDRHDDAAAARLHAHEVAFREAAARRIRGMKLDRGLARMREQRGHRAGA